MQHVWLTAVKNIAGWLTDVRQDDVVLAKPLSVKQETNITQGFTWRTCYKPCILSTRLCSGWTDVGTQVAQS